MSAAAGRPRTARRTAMPGISAATDATAAGHPQRGPDGGRMPALYPSHCAPPPGDDTPWTGQLAGWSAALPRPGPVPVVSAHWGAAPLALGATTTVPLVYDFWGFPEKYYEVTYPAAGAPGLAGDVRQLLRAAGTPVADLPGRG